MTTSTPFESGNLALDLLNTRPISDGKHIDRLTTAEALDRWLSAVGIREKGDVLSLKRASQQRVLDDTLQLRDAILRAASNLVEECQPEPSDVETLNGILAMQHTGDRIEVHDGCYIRVRIVDELEDSAMLAPIAEAAITLFTEIDVKRIRQCDDDGCVLWFVDRTRNGRRRWCSMATCGNRAKVAAHYRRQKSEASSD